MLKKVFKEIGLELGSKQMEFCGVDYETYDITLGDIDSLKYSDNLNWICMRCVKSRNKQGNLHYTIIGYFPTLNFNGVRNMLNTYCNTGIIQYGLNSKQVKIIDGKEINDKNYQRVVSNIKHYFEKFDEQENKIVKFLNNLNVQEFKNTTNALVNTIKDYQQRLDDYKEKFYKNVKSQLSADKDFQ